MGKNLREIKRIYLDMSTSKRSDLSTPVACTVTVSTAARLEGNSDYSRYPDEGDPEGLSKE
jgi:hypothetical protein